MKQYLQALGLPDDADIVTAFDSYYNLLALTNSHTNLTSIVDRGEVYALHFADSLLAHSLIGEGARVIDVGSGAGFPGLPLAIVRRDLEVLLVDSTLKKVKFLQSVIAELGLTNVKAMQARGEELRGLGFDVATARAVAPLERLIDYLLPPLKVGGYIVAYKSRNIEDELSAAAARLARRGAVVREVVNMKLPIKDIERKFVLIDKKR